MMRYAQPVEEARSTLRVSLQVAEEAHADGLLSPAELRTTVRTLRCAYTAQLAALGLDAQALPDPAHDAPPGSAHKAAAAVRACVCACCVCLFLRVRGAFAAGGCSF
jgi:hypothetical protein